MSKAFLKGLYTTLVADCLEARRGWYNGYVEEVKAVDEVRERLENDTHYHLTKANDNDFLKKLFWSNGVTTAGSDFFSAEAYDACVNDPACIQSLEALIRAGAVDIDAAKAAYARFEARVKEIVGSLGRNFPRNRVHRIAAACSTAIPTLASQEQFNALWDWLVSLDAIDGIGETDWYSRSLHIVSQLRDLFAEDLQLAQNEGENASIDIYLLNMFVWLLWEACVNQPFTMPQQVIKYGPPGTGKTYSAREEAKLAFDIWFAEFGAGSGLTFDDVYQFQQFHPSMGYEDFFEGLRPVTNAEGKTELKLQNGLFKNFCKEAGKWEIDLYLNKLIPPNGGSYLDCPVGDLEAVRGDKLSGTHWDYIFVLSAQKKKAKLRYVLPPFCFVVDEINRAELSRVFGELMFCFEYRGTGGLVSTQYAMLNDKKDAVIGEKGSAKFFIPTNLRFIGTMNTIDRSVESFDFALRRRFKWQYVSPNVNVLRRYLAKMPKEWMPLVDGWKSLNAAVRDNREKLGPDYQIGHAYLMKLDHYNEEESLNDIRWWIWNTSLLPLFEEYLRGDEEADNSIEGLRKKFYQK